MVFAMSCPLEINGQECPSCSATTSNTQAAGTLANPRAVSNNNAVWNSNFPGTSGIARFSNVGFYRWVAGGNNTVQIGGLILEAGVTLILDRSNDGVFEAFNIEGGCIVVKNNAVLDFRYFTALEFVNICVEPGGKVIFDSRRGGAGVRDDFTFDNVVINLQDPTATLEFGDADIQILAEDGLVINGWSGENICENNIPPAGGVSGNISWTSGTINICDVLNLSVLPVEWLYFNADFLGQERLVRVQWGTSKEWENSHFEILRSVGDIRSWQKIGEVNGLGWSDIPVDYRFEDLALPLTGGVIYYQLKQIDLNGSFSYSKTISVRVPPTANNGKIWRVFPNPTSGDKLSIELLDLGALKDGSVQVRLIQPNGITRFIDGNNLNVISENILIQLIGATKGVYILEISWGQKVEYLKVLRK
jgi:hypothetical protein